LNVETEMHTERTQDDRLQKVGGAECGAGGNPSLGRYGLKAKAPQTNKTSLVAAKILSPKELDWGGSHCLRLSVNNLKMSSRRTCQKSRIWYGGGGQQKKRATNTHTERKFDSLERSGVFPCHSRGKLKFQLFKRKAALGSKSVINGGEELPRDGCGRSEI